MWARLVLALISFDWGYRWWEVVGVGGKHEASVGRRDGTATLRIK